MQVQDEADVQELLLWTERGTSAQTARAVMFCKPVQQKSVPHGFWRSFRVQQQSLWLQAQAQDAADVQELIDRARATPKGQKKDVSRDMFKGYCPPAVEAAWYDWWEKCNFFKPEENSSKPPFVIVIPPPNVTGESHMPLTPDSSLYSDATSQCER